LVTLLVLPIHVVSMEDGNVGDEEEDMEEGDLQDDASWEPEPVPAGVPLAVDETPASQRTMSVDNLGLTPMQLIRGMEPWRPRSIKAPDWSNGGEGLVMGGHRMRWFMNRNKQNIRNPWDTDEDVTQSQPFNVPLEGSVPVHSPPLFLGDGDNPLKNSPEGRTSDWGNVVNLQQFTPFVPAFYAHGYKPTGYYKNPYNVEQSFLQVGARAAGDRDHRLDRVGRQGRLQPDGRSTSTASSIGKSQTTDMLVSVDHKSSSVESAGECMLLEGLFAYTVQSLLGVVALSALFLKRYWSPADCACNANPDRSCAVWGLDVSKQAIGAIFSHVCNIFLSVAFSKIDLNDGRDSGMAARDQFSEAVREVAVLARTAQRARHSPRFYGEGERAGAGGWDVNPQVPSSALLELSATLRGAVSGDVSVSHGLAPPSASLEAIAHPASDQCAWYAINYVLDCGLGVPIIWCLLQATSWAARQWGCRALARTGDYEALGRDRVCRTWLLQLGAWLWIVAASKVILALCMWPLGAFFGRLGLKLFEPLRPYPKVELVVVMVGLPCVLNVAVAWIYDNMLMKKAERCEDSADEKTGRVEHWSEGTLEGQDAAGKRTIAARINDAEHCSEGTRAYVADVTATPASPAAVLDKRPLPE
jgi:hypothetical protein